VAPVDAREGAVVPDEGAAGALVAAGGQQQAAGGLVRGRDEAGAVACASAAQAGRRRDMTKVMRSCIFQLHASAIAGQDSRPGYIYIFPGGVSKSWPAVSTGFA
jgi:hypothetical protein